MTVSRMPRPGPVVRSHSESEGGVVQNNPVGFGYNEELLTGSD